MNDFNNKRDTDLRQDVASIAAALQGRAEEFGLTDADIATLDEANNLFRENILVAMIKEADKRSAVERKNSARDEVVLAIGSIAKKIYANRSVDDSMLSSIGLAGRPNYGRKTHPHAPSKAVATTNGDGDVTVRWQRNGNSERVIFTVWAHGDDEPWRMVASTSRTKIMLHGFTPGVPQYFRVTASVNRETSSPSNSACIYGSMSTKTARKKAA